MFTKSLVVRAARPSTAPLQACCCSSAARLTTSSSSARPSSQPRRHSSSKTSCPPGSGARGSEPAADGEAARTPADEPKRTTGRVTRRKARDAAAELALKANDEAFASLPAVPPTTLHPSDIKLSSFFSLHRPLSITAPIPPPTTRSTFNAIFEQRPSKSSSAKTDDVIYTLSSTVSALDAATGAAASSGQQSSEEKDLRWEVLHSQGGVAPVQSLEQLVKQFRPFNVPPPPVPFDELEMTNKRRERQRVREREEATSTQDEADAQQEQHQATTTHKTYKTTLTISEATSADGRNTYTFSATPIVEHDDSTAAADDEATESATNLASPSTSSVQQTWGDPDRPLASRLRAMKADTDSSRSSPLDNEGEVTEAEAVAEVKSGRDAALRLRRKMVLISVKRRRQLKMKKHKYKKLMKRTRNLRRREGRL